MEKSLEQMKAGKFPQFAHAYLHPSLTEAEGLTVIDGTRRMLAYLMLGRSEMPVVVFRAVPRGAVAQATKVSESNDSQHSTDEVLAFLARVRDEAFPTIEAAEPSGERWR